MTRYVLFLMLGILVFFPFSVISQVDTTRNANINLLDDLKDSNDSVKLLPERMLFTQSILWGNKGLMRNFSTFKLTPDERTRELKIRRTMLKAHQALGFATLLGMVAQGVVGSQLYQKTKNLPSGQEYEGSLLDLHGGIAAGVNIMYFTTAGLALFAPPRMVSERKGLSSIKIHKMLAIIHLSSMIATNILAGQVEGNPEMQKWHKIAAFTAFGSFAAAMVVIKF